MSNYLKDKAAAEFLNKEREFNKGMQNLKSAPVKMVDDFQKPLVKDVPVEKIVDESLPLKSGAEFQADQIMREARKEALQQAGSSLNYKDLKKEFANKAKLAARSPAGKKVLGAVPFLGAGMAALSGEPAMAAEELAEDFTGPAGAIYGAAKPAMTGPEAGTFDDRMERGQLTEEDKQRLMLEQARIKALQGVN